MCIFVAKYDYSDVNSAILFLVFNRPESTHRVFQEIRKARPSKLFVAADGPRKARPGEAELCEETRSVIKVDWPCEVKTLYRSENLGCRKAVSSGIDWFFSQVDEGIVLEDDCLPESSFFVMCDLLLERYRHDERVSHIGAANFQDSRWRGDGDYYFSNMTHVWGWASWQRVWKSYDVNMSLWPGFRQQRYLQHIFPDKAASKRLEGALQMTFEGKIDTWDYQLFFSNLATGGLSIIPNKNLVKNIGFNAAATHTHNASINSELPTFAMESFQAPAIMRADVEADLFTMNREMLAMPAWQRTIARLTATLK